MVAIGDKAKFLRMLQSLDTLLDVACDEETLTTIPPQEKDTIARNMERTRQSVSNGLLSLGNDIGLRRQSNV